VEAQAIVFAVLAECAQVQRVVLRSDGDPTSALLRKLLARIDIPIAPQ
jgi:hypothetical protein